MTAGSGSGRSVALVSGWRPVNGIPVSVSGAFPDHLGQGRVGVNQGSQIRDIQPLMHRRGYFGNQHRSFFANNGAAQESPVSPIRQQLDKSLRFPFAKSLAIGPIGKITGFEVDLACLASRFGQDPFFRGARQVRKGERLYVR